MSLPSEPTPAPVKPLHKNETLKAGSNFLRGNILRDLADHSTGAITEDSGQLTKFHGIYGQDDRDLRNQRRKEGKEKAFSFMARIRVPGGVCTPAQWVTLDALADSHANGTLKLTTRQAFQFHGILKGDLWRTINAVNRALLDTLAACGDVNRNVMCNPNPEQSALHAETLRITKAIADHLLPRTRAYHEIWVGGDTLVAGGEPEAEPIYGATYLPRKFKIVVAIPPSNDVDIYAHDLGFIAIADAAGKKLLGFNITVGGGLGMSHNQLETFPRIADVLGFCTVDQVTNVAEKILTTQRDFGDRTDRKHARLKYVVAERGADWTRAEIEKRANVKMAPAKPFKFLSLGDLYGWNKQTDGRWFLTLFVETGRVKDVEGRRLKTALRQVAEKFPHLEFRLTTNQNVILANIPEADRAPVNALLADHGIKTDKQASVLHSASMACPALPTCGLALAESERMLPGLIDRLETLCGDLGLGGEEIIIRSTGCPNGCARPYMAEIAFVGKAPGRYQVWLGGDAAGTRLNRMWKDMVKDPEIENELRPLLTRFAKERSANERFGDWCDRSLPKEASAAAN